MKKPPHHKPQKPVHHKPKPPAHVSKAVQKARHQSAVKAAKTRARHAAKAARRARTSPAPKARKPRALSEGLPCVAVAVAASLGLPEDWMVPFCPDDPDGVPISDVLEGLAGVLPVTFWPVDPQDAPAGAVLGLAFPGGGHAALYRGAGLMWSFGQVMPVCGDAEEAWWAEWAA